MKQIFKITHYLDKKISSRRIERDIKYMMTYFDPQKSKWIPVKYSVEEVDAVIRRKGKQ
jgi:hypothetical protein